MRIVILGYLVRGPLGGLAWHHLQYVIGLAGLGHQVHFLEDSDDYPSCYDPLRGVTDTDPTYGLDFAARTFSAVGLPSCWSYYDAHTDRWRGPCADDVRDICGTADLLLNLSGVNPLRPWTRQIPVRVFVDTDPAFTQIRHLTDPQARRLADAHTSFFSFGENLETGNAQIPADGYPWKATRQPVVLAMWPSSVGPAAGRFTSVLQWDSYQSREYQGRRYGMKSESFSQFMDVPARVEAPLELALGSPTAPRQLLKRHGWALRDPQQVTADLWTYRDYLHNSRAEFGVAKHGYVVSHSGWFSERSAAYLASGRPVAVQETGFSSWLPTGSGVFSFSDADQAVAAIDEICSDYPTHCRAARQVAEDYFDSAKVLPSLLERAVQSA